MHRLLKLTVTVAASLVAVACSHRNRMDPVLAAYETGQYSVASEALVPLLEDRRDSEKDRTIYELEAGAVYAAGGEIEKSIEAFGAADDRMWEYLDDAPEVRISEQAAAILTNQTIINYFGRPHDRIMCCTYQGLNHLSRGDLEKAGVSFRRALEWQQDAVTKNEKEVEALQERASADSKAEGYDSQRALEDERTKQGFESAYGPLRDMKGYGKFEIPYAVFLRAIHQQLLNRTDSLQQATEGFRRTAGMLSDEARDMVMKDAELAEQVTNGSTKLPPMVYVICESGMAPMLEELRIDIPLFIPSVPYVGAAFPVIKFREGAPGPFRLRSGDASVPSVVLTDMDRVVAEEFNQRLPAIITMTLVSSATKAIATAVAQQAAEQQGGNAALFIALVGAVYQVSTNSADLRTWLTLPKQVQYARLEAPASGSLEVELGDGQKIGPINVESGGTTLVHVRAPRAGVAPAVRTIRFPGTT
jgi:uncharacterized protein